MTTSDINLNAQNCIVKTYDFGAVMVSNICNGATARIEWGTLDYVGMTLVLILLGSVVALMLGLLISLIRG